VQFQGGNAVDAGLVLGLGAGIGEEKGMNIV